MADYESLSHTAWACKYHVVFIPKCRRKALYQELRRYLGEYSGSSRCRRIESRGRAFDARPCPHAAVDSAEICGVAGRGVHQGQESAIHLARVYGERKRNFVGQHFWARRFFVNTVGRDEEAIRTYVRNQEREDQRLEQMNLWR